MIAVAGKQEICADFGRALQYPDAEFPAVVERLCGALPEHGDESVMHMRAFASCAAANGEHALQEHYTRAFDLGPIAPPYLSIYLFGAESVQRGPFMAGLSEAYAAQHFERGGELPDHLSVVLRFAERAASGEWTEICRWCLGTPVRQMRRALEDGGSPYAHLLASLDAFLRNAGDGESGHD